jgi:energy-coupling factor transporter ATP-binding protein EcfA2
MMKYIEVVGLNFQYSDEEKLALKNIHFHIHQGEFVVICGASGSGKTTLLRQFKKEIRPKGTIFGGLFIQGISVKEEKHGSLEHRVCFVNQNPDHAMVMELVIHELAFGLENIGISPKEIKRRLSEMCTYFGIEGLLYQSVDDLSGGQKQMVCLCSALMLKPSILLLDEPTSQLDPVASNELIKMIHQVNQEFQVTVILTEHRLNDVYAMADRILFMHEGEMKWNCSPKELVDKIVLQRDASSYLYLPSIAQLYFRLRVEEKVLSHETPLHIKDGRQWMQEIFHSGQRSHFTQKSHLFEKDEGGVVRSIRKEILTLKDVTHAYGRKSKPVLKDVCFQLKERDCIGILGGNGSGKSTLLQVMAGLIKPQYGKVKLKGKDIFKVDENLRYQQIGYVGQDSRSFFAFDTVREEIEHAHSRAMNDKESEKTRKLLETFQIEALMEKHPYDLSGGEQQKLVLACVLLSQPEILLLDEPTKGIDPKSKMELAKRIKEWHAEGKTVVVVTHDIEFAAQFLETCVMLFNGELTEPMSPRDFFSENYFYTTNIHKITRNFMDRTITVEDVMEECKVQKEFLDYA